MGVWIVDGTGCTALVAVLHCTCTVKGREILGGRGGRVLDWARGSNRPGHKSNRTSVNQKQNRAEAWQPKINDLCLVCVRASEQKIPG